MLPFTEPVRTGLLAVCAMLDAGWPMLLAVLSFLLNMNLSDSLFGDVLGALQLLTTVTGCLTMPTPCGVFFIAFIKAALPPHVVAVLDESPDTDIALIHFAQGFYFGPGQRGQSATAAGAQSHLRLWCTALLHDAASFHQDEGNLLLTAKFLH
jgi:hypothetical protein